MIGWANLSVKSGELKAEFGYINCNPPQGRDFQRELGAELERLRIFCLSQVLAQAASLCSAPRKSERIARTTRRIVRKMMTTKTMARIPAV